MNLNVEEENRYYLGLTVDEVNNYLYSPTSTSPNAANENALVINISLTSG
jgi:hypothetical protein